jgi:dTDP-L-rhamnose 4-epimerase
VAPQSILITGGTGLIGSHLAGKLAQCGYKVTVLGKSSRFAVPEAVPQSVASQVDVIAGDSSDPHTLEELVKKADVVFHKAASVGMAGAVESARDYVGANMAGTANLVDALRSPESKVKKVILGSSVSVYGEGNYKCPQCGIVRPQPRGVQAAAAKNPSEWNPTCPSCRGAVEAAPTQESARRNGESIYAVTKKAQEDLLAGVCRQAGIPLSILRYSTVLGPGQSWHNPYTRVLELLAAGESPVIHEDGMQTRDFIFVDDLVEANLLALTQQHDANIDIFNVSSLHMPLLHFVREMAQAVADVLSRKPVEPVVDGKLIAGDVRHCWVDCGKMHELLRFHPQEDLPHGAQSLVEWFVRFKGLTPARS